MLLTFTVMAAVGYGAYEHARRIPPAPSQDSVPGKDVRPSRPLTNLPVDPDFIPSALAGKGDPLEQWRVISGFSEKQVTAAVSELEAHSQAPGALFLGTMLYYRWGQLAPREAVAAETRTKLQLPRRILFGPETPAVLAWKGVEPDAVEMAQAIQEQEREKRESEEKRIKAEAPPPTVFRPRPTAHPTPPPEAGKDASGDESGGEPPAP